jgi:hypothetical protein
MSGLTSQQRKLVYIGGIVLLLIPIVWLGRPAAPARKNDPNSADAGGTLAQMRAKYELGEASLGNVDPSSATMNLVLLGLRGLASDLLWVQLDHQKDHKQWSEMRSTTESIIMLQPHFIKVWQFNGWNLAYNVSVEWDDVRDRYYWVKEGIKFYRRGTERNAQSTELLWYTGDTYGKKIGRSDEWRQFRRYFHVDPDKTRWNPADQPGPDRALNPDDKDNYEVAQSWFELANEIEPQYVQHIMARIIFRQYPARAVMDLAAVRQREGKFDEITRNAWERGYEIWTKQYGQEQYDTPGGMIHLEWTPEEIAAVSKSKDEELSLRNWLNKQQDMVNYRYWRTRALAEREQNTVRAHYDLYKAERDLLAGDTKSGEELAYSGMEKFQKMLERFPSMKDEDDVIEEALMGKLVWRYCLDLNGHEEPEDYPLKAYVLSKQDRLPQIEPKFKARFSHDAN